MQLNNIYIYLICLFSVVSISAQEICDNGIDDDADGLIDCGDTSCYGDVACADAYECTNTLYQVISATLKELNVVTSSYDDIGVASSRYNGGGFNFQDGYIYGVNRSNGSSRLWKIDNSGREQDLGIIDNFGGLSYTGDFDHSGNLYTYKSGSFPVLYYVDVNVTPLKHIAQDLTNLSGYSIPGAADITYNPVNQKFYGLASNRKIIVIDPIALTIDLDETVVGDVTTSGAFGAAYSDSEGNSYFSNNNDGRIYKLSFYNDGSPLNLLHVATGEPTNSNDGMACSNSLPPFETDCSDGMDNDGDGLVDCDDPDCFIDSTCPRLSVSLSCIAETGPNGIIPFHLKLINNSEADAIDFTIQEILPHGMSMLYDTISLSTGASQVNQNNRPAFGDRGRLSWGTLNIPVGDTLEIQYSVLVDSDATEGIYTNDIHAEGVLLDPNFVTCEILVSNYLIDAHQILSCDPAFYQVYKKKGEPNTYAKLDVETGDYTEIAPISHQANGLGFDYLSGLAYGAEGQLFISLDSVGTVENLGQVFNRKVYVGDTDTLGNYWGKDGNDMVKIHIESMLDAQTNDLITRYPGAGMPGWDMAYNKDGNFYAVHNKTLYKFDPNTGEEETLGALVGDAVPNSGFGAQWTGSDGRLYISNNATGQIFRVDVVSRETKLMMQSTAGLRFNDGFSCPLEIPAPLTFDHHDYSLFPAASIFTYSQSTDGIPDLPAVWAGNGVDIESQSLAFTTADLDQHDDGLRFNTYLPSGSTSNWEISLNTNFEFEKETHFGLWIDWNADEKVDSFYNGSATIAGLTTVALPVVVPPTFSDTTVAVRLIVSEISLTADDIDLYEDDVTGEVEDYQFYGNTTVDCGNGLDDDNDGLVDCDDPDCYESCEFTTTKSGFDGGLESNDRLSHKVNLVNYNKKRGVYGRGYDRDVQGLLSSASMKKALKGYNKSNAPIEAYMPIDAITNTESRESSPRHLLSITNATELYAIDIYEGDNRKGAVLGLRSSEGVYEHTKYVCDRLAGSKILDILTYNTQLVSAGENPSTVDVDLIIPKLELEEGLIEYALSISVRETIVGGEVQWVMESHWNLADYKKDEDYLNFQIWASSVHDLEILLRDIYNKITDTNEFGKKINETIIGSSPVFYINAARYEDDHIFLDITNKSNLSDVSMTGTMSYTETDDEQEVDLTVNLTGASEQTIMLDLGRVYDLGVTFYHESLNAHDVIFLSDGSWNTSFNESVDVLTSFESTPGDYFAEDHYEMDRDISVTGSITNYINVFRSFNSNFTAVDVDAYENLNFTISGQGTIEVAIMKEEVDQFRDQGKFLLELSDEARSYSLTKNHFKNDDGVSGDWSDVFMVQFTVIGDGQSAQDFELNVADLYWGPNQLEEDFVVYTAINTIENIDSDHVANRADGTDRGDIELRADFVGDTLKMTIENLGIDPIALEDLYIDSESDEFELIGFEPLEIAAGLNYKVMVRYNPQATPMESVAELRMTIDGDDSFAISLRGGTVCPLVDNVSTAEVEILPNGSDRSYAAVERISSNAQINQRNISFTAGQEIILDIGFEVGSQSIFNVELDDSCSID